MKFEEALKAMREGNKIKRKNYNCCFFLENNQIFVIYQYCFKDKHIEIKEHFWHEEIIAEDWKIVDVAEN